MRRVFAIVHLAILAASAPVWGSELDASAVPPAFAFTPRQVPVTGPGGKAADEGLLRPSFQRNQSSTEYGEYDTTRHYQLIEKNLALGGYPSESAILEYADRQQDLDGVHGDWRSFATLLANSSVTADAIRHLMMGEPQQTLCMRLYTLMTVNSTQSGQVVPEWYFNAVNFAAFLSPSVIAKAVGGEKYCFPRANTDAAVELMDFLIKLNPELVRKEPRVVGDLLKEFTTLNSGHNSYGWARPKERAYREKLAGVITRALANGGTRPEHLELLFASVESGESALEKDNYPAFAEASAKMATILVNAGAPAAMIPDAAPNSASARVNAAIAAAAPDQVKAAEQAQVSQQQAEDARYNLATLADAIAAGDGRKTEVFLLRVFAGPPFQPDPAVLAALKAGQTETALKLLDHANARPANPGQMLAEAAKVGNEPVMARLGRDEAAVLQAMDDVQLLARDQGVDGQRALAARLAALGSDRARAKLAALDARIADDRRKASEEKAQREQQAKEQERQRAAQQERDRQSYLAAKTVGEKVCKPGTVALGLIDVTVSAYVERIDNNRIQLRINSTEGQSINYDGGALIPGKVIWDEAGEWKHCN